MRRELINFTLENNEIQKICFECEGTPDEKQIGNEVSKMETILKVYPPLKMLDIGCGTGGYSMEFASRGYEVTAIDAGETYLKKAIEKAINCNLNIDFRLESGSKINNQSRYDFAIVDYHNLFFLVEAEINAYLENVYKLLKDGGEFLIRTVGSQIIPNIEGERIQNWSEKDNKFILNEEYIKDGYRVERFVTMDIIKDEIVEYQEKQKAFSLTNIIDLLGHVGFSKIDCYKGLDGDIATNEEFGVYLCRK